MSAAMRLFKLGLAHRKEIQSAYAKNGTDMRAHRNDAMSHGYDAARDTGTAVATAPLRAAENIPRLVVRGLQFVLGLVMVGLYGVRAGDGADHPEHAAATWWLGLAVAVAACTSALVLALTAPLGALARRFKTHHLFGLDLCLSLCWFVVFGIFFHIFHGRSSDDSYKGSSTLVQKSATWLDLVNALLWMVSGVYGFIKTWVGRRRDAVFLRGKEAMQDRLASREGSTKEDFSKEEMYKVSSISEPEQVYYQGRGRTGEYYV